MWSCKLRGVTACVVAWCAFGVLADEEPEWVQLYRQGEPKLEEEAGPLPIEISGNNFTLERLEKYLAITLVEGNATNYRPRGAGKNATEELPMPSAPRALPAPVLLIFKGLQLFCGTVGKSLCQKFSEGGFNDDKFDQRLLNVNVGAENYEWDEVENWKPKRTLPGSYFYFTNGFGIRVIEVWYDWDFYYGGQIAEGGAFIRGATPLVSYETGALKYMTVNSRTRVVKNAGTINAPIASVDIEVDFITTNFKKSCIATIQGDGKSWVHDGCTGGSTPADSSVDPCIESCHETLIMVGSIAGAALGIIILHSLWRGSKSQEQEAYVYASNYKTGTDRSL
eukprot:CAMPEP_0184548828 /NCGR_PEP_ID=MMETSP0199_2-20130426/6440_1 /TAXON_ID=1112570 /ORGANISM="Thraustochytrium sp., Strain LLF1b" /LENGTH=337 /DNA_ID=CAMNT_0026943487 /DNA_START=46 /DNA_END=1059 /DNA_ORIENTATION=+